jgi:hypothetical protein
MDVKGKEYAEEERAEEIAQQIFCRGRARRKGDSPTESQQRKDNARMKTNGRHEVAIEEKIATQQQA